jgi:hypothetical protein
MLQSADGFDLLAADPIQVVALIVASSDSPRR